jgi:CheY-like chemotaxis protein
VRDLAAIQASVICRMAHVQASSQPWAVMDRVLIIEDDADIREALAELLQAAGYECAGAANGAEGLVQVRRQRPDVILLDLMMPVMDGWQFRAHQRWDATMSDIPIVVMSASERGGDLEGAAACLPKPYSVDDLLDAVARCRDVRFRQPASRGPAGPAEPLLA